MKLLLTSGGVTKPTIHAALVGMLGRPVEVVDDSVRVVSEGHWVQLAT